MRFTFIRLILTTVSKFDFELSQMDVKTAFTNVDLEKEIYMEQPTGFVKEYYEHKMCRILKSIYGLMWSSRQW